MLLSLCKCLSYFIIKVACYLIARYLMASYSLAAKQEKENDHFVIFLSFGFFGIVLNILLCLGSGMRLKFGTRNLLFSCCPDRIYPAC